MLPINSRFVAWLRLFGAEFILDCDGFGIPAVWRQNLEELHCCRPAVMHFLHPSTHRICSIMNKNPPEALGDKVKRHQTQKSFSSPSKCGMLYMNHLLGFIKDKTVTAHSSFTSHLRQHKRMCQYKNYSLERRSKMKKVPISPKQKCPL